MEILKQLYKIKNKLSFILFIVISTTLVSFIINSYLIEPKYEAKVKLIVGRAPSDINERSGYNDVLMYQKLVNTYGELAESQLVASETLLKLKYNISIESFSKNLKVIPHANTQILEITYKDMDASRSVVIVNTLSEVFIKKSLQMIDTGNIKVIDEAQIPVKPTSPRILLNVLATFLVTIMLSISLVFLLEYYNNTLKTDVDIEKYLGISVLADIPCIRSKHKGKKANGSEGLLSNFVSKEVTK